VAIELSSACFDPGGRRRHGKANSNQGQDNSTIKVICGKIYTRDDVEEIRTQKLPAVKKEVDHVVA
jgi:hypothetical protein